MRVGYCRVSTQKAGQDISLEGQHQQLLAAGCDEVIVERASAFKGQRKGWTRLWALVASGKVTEVLVVDQSRLSRSGDDLEFLQACAVKNVTVRALTGGVIETESVGGFIQAGVMSVMNQAYSRLNSAKVKDGLARRRAAGHYAIGMVPFGYAYVDGVVVPHPENWGPARQRWDDLMAMEMNLLGYVRKNPGTSRTGLKGWIQNPMLRGIVPRQEGGVKPLISLEEWESAKRLLSHRARSRVRTEYQQKTYLFSGLVTCDGCGKRLVRVVTDYRRTRLKCMCPSCEHFGRSIKEELVRQQVVEVLRLEAPQMALAAQQASNAMASEKTSEQVEATRKLLLLEELQASGVPGLDTSIEILREQLVPASPATSPDWQWLADAIAAAGVLERFSDKQLRPLLLEFVESITYLGNPREVKVMVRKGHG